MSRRTHSLNAYEVGLTSGISDVDISFPVESVVGLLAPGYLVVDPDDPLKREYFKFESINGSNLEMPSTAFRGLTGSANGAQAHLAGARVRAVAVGQWLDDIFSDIEDLEAADAAFLPIDGSVAMTGPLNMGGNKVTVLGEGTLADDVVTKGYVDAADLLFLLLDGTRPMTGALDMAGLNINQLGNPLVDADAATKKYVDDLVQITDDKLALYLRLDGTSPATTGAIDINAGMHFTTVAPISGFDYPSGGLGYTMRRNVIASDWDVSLVPGLPGGGGVGLSVTISQDGGAFETVAHFGKDATQLIKNVQFTSGRAFTLAGTTFTLEQDSGAAIALTDGTLLESIAGTSLTSLSLNGLDFLNAAAPFLRAANGVVTAPTYAFSADKDTGLYRPSADQIGMAAGGVSVYQAGTNFSYIPLAITNIRWQGIASIGSTGSAANMFINTTAGNWARSTSGLQYKSDVDYDTDWLADLELKPITFHHDGDDGDYIGFAADDIADLDERMGQFDEDGTIQNYETEAIVAILAAKMRRLESAVEALAT